MRNFLVVLGSAIVLLVGGSGWAAFYPPVPVDLAGAENLDAKARHVRIPLKNGDALDGWYLPPRNGAVMLILHGYGRDHTRAWRYGGFLGRAGYGVLAFDFRSSRSSSRLPTTLGYYEIEDARAALAWLHAQPDGRSARIGLLGESLGGAVAMVLTAEDKEVSALVVDCAFASGRLALEDACERWAHLPRWPSAVCVRELGRLLTGHDPWTLDAVAAAATLQTRPVFFIHSLKDDRLSTEHPLEMWRAAGEKDPLWIIPDAGHTQGWELHKRLYEERVLAFLDQTLRGKGAGLPAGAL